MALGKFIFLDFDGVVCTNRTYKAWRKEKSPKTLDGYKILFDQAIVAMINDIATQTGAKLIASTNWRLPSICAIPLADLIPHVGFTAELVGQTPDLEGKATRGGEIAAYIAANGLTLDQFIILDDDAYAGSAPKIGTWLRHGGRWIQTSEATGLTPKQALRAIKMLGGSPPFTEK